MNVLVVKPSSLGDIIHTFPAVDLLKKHCPDAFIAWVVNDVLAEIVELLPAVDEIIPFERQRFGRLRHCHEILPFFSGLRQRQYDIALDFQGLLRSGLIAFMSRAPRRVGFTHAREGARVFYTERVPLPANLRHAVDKNLFLVRAVFDIEEPWSFPELKPQHDFATRAERLIRQHELVSGPVLAVAPAARWRSKMWPPAFFAAVIDKIAKRLPELRCWLLGTHDEQAAARAVVAACEHSQPRDLTGETSLGVLVEMLRRTDVLLTNDSGPMHLAAALEVPTVALFGATDPSLTGPYGEEHVVLTGQCELAPCLAKQCPLDNRRCVEGVSADDAAELIGQRLLQAADRKRGQEAQIDSTAERP